MLHRWQLCFWWPPKSSFWWPQGVDWWPPKSNYWWPPALIGDPQKLKKSKNQISIKFFSDYDWVSKTSLRCVFSISNIRLSIWYMYNRFFDFFQKCDLGRFYGQIHVIQHNWIWIEDRLEWKNKRWDLEELIKSVLFHIHVIEIWWIFKEIEAREKILKFFVCG